jgi:hypothetical protein
VEEEFIFLLQRRRPKNIQAKLDLMGGSIPPISKGLKPALPLAKIYFLSLLKNFIPSFFIKRGVFMVYNMNIAFFEWQLERIKLTVDNTIYQIKNNPSSHDDLINSLAYIKIKIEQSIENLIEDKKGMSTNGKPIGII